MHTNHYLYIMEIDEAPTLFILTGDVLYYICTHLTTKEKIDFIAILLVNTYTKDVGKIAYHLIQDDINKRVDQMIKDFKWKFPTHDALDYHSKRKEAVRRFFHDDKYCKYCGFYADISKSRKIILCVYSTSHMASVDTLYITRKNDKLACLDCVKRIYREEKCICGKFAMVTTIPTVEHSDIPFLLKLKCGAAPDGFPASCGTNEIFVRSYHRNYKTMIIDDYSDPHNAYNYICMPADNGCVRLYKSELHRTKRPRKQ